jgi:[ribosomal protein S5]-alanine N-acetyltransferase
VHRDLDHWRVLDLRPADDRGVALRPPVLGDCEPFLEATADPGVAAAMGGRTWDAGLVERYLRDADDRRRARTGLTLVIAGSDAPFLGLATLAVIDRENGIADVGFWVVPAARGRGVATSALRTLVLHAVGLGLPRLVAQVETRNEPAISVLRRVGFATTGTASLLSGGEILLLERMG